MKNIVSFEVAQRLKKLGFNLPTKNCYIRCRFYDDTEKRWKISNDRISNIFSSLYIDDENDSVANRFASTSPNAINGDYDGKTIIRCIYDYYTDFENIDYAIEDVDEFDWNKVNIFSAIVGMGIYEELQSRLSNNEEKIDLQLVHDYVDTLVSSLSIFCIDYDKFELLGEKLYMSHVVESISKEKHNLLGLNKKLEKLFNSNDFIITQEDIDSVTGKGKFDCLSDFPELISAPEYFEVLIWAENKGLHLSITWNDVDNIWVGTIKEKPEIKSTGNNYEEILKNLINDTIYYLTAYDV